MMVRWVCALVVLCLCTPGASMAAGASRQAEAFEGTVIAKGKRKRRRKRRKKRRRRAKAPAKKVVAPITPAVQPEPAPAAQEPKAASPKPEPEKASEPLGEGAVAVLELKAMHGVEASLAALLAEVVLTRLAESKAFPRVIGGSDLRDLMSLEQQKQVMGCGDDSCLAELGGALGVPFLVSPSLGKLGSVFVINLKVTDVENASVKGRISREVATVEALKGELEAAVDELLVQVFALQPPAAPAAEARPAMERPRWRRLSWVVGGVGALSLGASYGVHRAAVDAFDQSSKTLADYDEAFVQTQQANTILGVGASSLGAAALLWWLGGG